MGLQVGSGNGFGRLMLAIKSVVQEAGIALPTLFENPLYQRMGQFTLTTAQVRHEHDLFTFFGPWQGDGYMICYDMKRDKINGVLSSFKTSNFVDIQRYADMCFSSITSLYRPNMKHQICF